LCAMSAKRVKNPGLRRERRSVPVPIFGAAAPLISESGAMIDAAWNVEWLVRVVGALEMQHVTQKANALLPFEDFYTLVKKVGRTWNPSVSTIIQQSPTPTPKKLYEYSEPEKVLYDLVCATDNVLYKLGFELSSVARTWEAASDERIWCLERLMFDGNRLQELHKLATKTKISKLTSDSASRAILQHREAQRIKNEQSVTTFHSVSQPKQLDALILAGMSLEERVRARAEAKQVNQAAVQGAAVADDSKSDREWLVRLADALWAHSQNFLHSHLHTPLLLNKRKKASNCVMTLKDAVNLLSLSSAKSSGLIGRGGSLSKRQVMDAVQDMCRMAPDWIHISEGSNGLLSPDSTVWIKPADFGSVRIRLAGRNANKQPATDLPETTISTTPNTSNCFKDSTPAKLPAYTKLTNSTPHSSVAQDELNGELVATDVRLKRPTESVGEKRMNSQEAEGFSLHPAKKRKILRINPNLIFTDADYDGGDVIDTSSFESPRGLKYLFLRMNAGERI
jgi:hypothetical protein